MSNIKQFLVGLAVAGVGFLGLSGMAFADSGQTAAGAVPAAQAPSNTVPAGTVMSDLALGNANAPVTVIEYASLTCPHCAEFYDVTFPTVKKDLIDTGKIKYIYRDFPLDQMALKAAMLARCSGPQSYYGYIDVLFKQQLSWATERNPIDGLRELARLGGMTNSTFDACMNSKAVEQAVLDSRLQAQKTYKVDSTPSFIINGVTYSGAMSYAEFDKLIEPLLAKTLGAAAPATPAASAAATPAPTSTPAAAAQPAAQPVAADPDENGWLIKGAIAAIVVLVVAGLGLWVVRRRGGAA